MTDEERIVRFMIEKQGRLGSIKRFSTIPNVNPETVAEHSYHVTFLTMLIADYLWWHNTEVDAEKAMKMSLLHDIEESVSGDILGPLKRGSLGKELTELAARSVGYLCDCLGVPANFYYFKMWQEYADQKSLEARIVKLADFATLLIQAVKEIQCGNKYFKTTLREVSKDLCKDLEDLGADDPLTPLVSGFYDYTLKYLEGDQEVMAALEECAQLEVFK